MRDPDCRDHAPAGDRAGPGGGSQGLVSALHFYRPLSFVLTAEYAADYAQTLVPTLLALIFELRATSVKGVIDICRTCFGDFATNIFSCLD